MSSFGNLFTVVGKIFTTFFVVASVKWFNLIVKIVTFWYNKLKETSFVGIFSFQQTIRGLNESIYLGY